MPRWLVIAALVVTGCSKPAAELPELGTVPAFALVDHHGQPFTRAQLDGAITVADFVFTRCETVCPLVTLRMRRLQEDTRGLADQVQLVSFSVDPAHDTTEVLAAYARDAAAEPRWRFVTGDPNAVRALLDGGFKVAMDPIGTTDAGAPNVIHSEHFVLIDRRGVIRGYYDSSDEGRMKALLGDVRALAR